MPSKKNDAAAQQLFEAIDVITTAKLKNLSYDKSFKANIENADKAGAGIYICKTEDLVFAAVGGYNQYKVGDTVWVSVPQNNWDNQKHILGKYVSYTSQNTYISPFEEFFCPDEKPFYTSTGQAGVISNNKITIDKFNRNDSVYTYYYFQNAGAGAPFKAQSYLNKEAYTALGVKASFLVKDLNPYSIVGGELGIKIEFVNNAGNIIGEFKFSSDQFLGSIYNLSSFVEFEQVFDIDSKIISETTGIQIRLYENEDFTYSKATGDTNHPYTTETFYWEDDEGVCQKPLADHMHDNIVCQSVKLYMGYNTRDLVDKTYILNIVDSIGGLAYWSGWNDTYNTKKFTTSYLYKDDNGKWHREVNRIDHLLRSMGSYSGNYESVVDVESGYVSPSVNYTITKDERGSTSTSILFKARIDLENDDLVDSNIITCYKFDNGSADTKSGEDAAKSDDQKKEEQVDTDRQYKSLITAGEGRNEYIPHWLNGFATYLADVGLDKGNIRYYATENEGGNRLPHPTIGYYHKKGTRLTDMRISISSSDDYENGEWVDKKDDHWRLGNANLMSGAKPGVETYLTDNQGFNFAHHTAWSNSDPTTNKDYAKSCIIGLEFTDLGKEKIMPREDRYGKTWKNVRVRPETLPLAPQLWKVSFYTNADPESEDFRIADGRVLGNWPVTLEILKYSLDCDPNTGIPKPLPNETQFVFGRDTDFLVINAKDIFNGLSGNTYENCISLASSIRWSDEDHPAVPGPANYYAHSSYLEAILYFRLSW